MRGPRRGCSLPDTLTRHATRSDAELAFDEVVARYRDPLLRQREALVSHVVAGEAHADPAVRLGVSEGATKNLVNRARVTLAAAREARAA